jgi:peroxiredoxin
MLAASALSAVSMRYLGLLPSTMGVIRPDFEVPYRWCSTALVAAVPIVLYTSAVLLIWGLNQLAASRNRMLLASLGAFLLALPTYAASYALIYGVQAPRFERYMMIEGREWQTHVGDPAPDVSFTTLDGSTKRLSDFRGKLVILNFFATWCGPCNRELPHLDELWSGVKDNDGIVMFVISRKESPEIVTPFIAEHGFTFPVALDPEAAAFSQFAKEGIPRTYLIARDGTILFQTRGFADVPVYQRELATLRQIIHQELSRH